MRQRGLVISAGLGESASRRAGCALRSAGQYHRRRRTEKNRGDGQPDCVAACQHPGGRRDTHRAWRLPHRQREFPPRQPAGAFLAVLDWSLSTLAIRSPTLPYHSGWPGESPVSGGVPQAWAWCSTLALQAGVFQRTEYVNTYWPSHRAPGHRPSATGVTTHRLQHVPHSRGRACEGRDWARQRCKTRQRLERTLRWSSRPRRRVPLAELAWGQVER